MMFAVGRFGNVVSDDSFHSVACFSFLSNILSICIATKRKNIGAGLRGCTTPFFDKHYVLPLTLTLAPSLIPSPHRGQSDGARDKVCHPELVSGSKLSANHTSPYPLLLRRGYSSLYKSRLVESFYKFLNI